MCLAQCTNPPLETQNICNKCRLATDVVFFFSEHQLIIKLGFGFVGSQSVSMKTGMGIQYSSTWKKLYVTWKHKGVKISRMKAHEFHLFLNDSFIIMIRSHRTLMQHYSVLPHLSTNKDMTLLVYYELMTGICKNKNNNK